MAKLAAELRANRALVTLLAACTAPRCSGIGPSPFTHAAHVHRHHYRTRTGSTGSPGRWITGSLGRWVTKCDQVPSLVSTDWHPGDGRESCSPWHAAARASDVVSHNQATNTYRVPGVDHVVRQVPQRRRSAVGPAPIHQCLVSPRDTYDELVRRECCSRCIDSSHIVIRLVASRFSPPPNYVNRHLSTMWFVVRRWPLSQPEGDWARP